jgi:hypothetical protein
VTYQVGVNAPSSPVFQNSPRPCLIWLVKDSKSTPIADDYSPQIDEANANVASHEPVVSRRLNPSTLARDQATEAATRLARAVMVDPE